MQTGMDYNRYIIHSSWDYSKHPTSYTFTVWRIWFEDSHCTLHGLKHSHISHPFSSSANPNGHHVTHAGGLQAFGLHVVIHWVLSSNLLVLPLQLEKFRIWHLSEVTL